MVFSQTIPSHPGLPHLEKDILQSPPLQEDLTTEINLPVMIYLRQFHFRERIQGDYRVSSWPIKNVNIFVLFNIPTKQIGKITHTSQAPFLWRSWNSLQKQEDVTFLVSFINSFFKIIIYLPMCPTYSPLKSFYSFIHLAFILYLLCAGSNRYKIL